MNLTLKQFVDQIRECEADQEAYDLVRKHFLVTTVGFQYQPEEREYLSNHPQYILESLSRSISRYIMSLDNDTIDFDSMPDPTRVYTLTKTITMFRPEGDVDEITARLTTKEVEAHPATETNMTPESNDGQPTI